MTSLPTGTVTLLFTDIEGSTRLWETNPAAMRAALERHDALVRHCIDDHDGHVFKTGGDAFCAAFHTASDAFAAALDAQRALHREPWPEAAKLRVRMALHSGAVELRDGDYFGAPLNRVARLLAAAHGGQTLLSESTHDLCRDHLPPLASVKALGAHGLKDLARPEAVFQVCHPELPQGFPPLKSQAAPADKETPSIAVLPFVNMSRDEENEYFADGLSEELLNVLAKIRGLRVASRTSAFSFKGKDVDIPTVAQRLNVATVLEGSVRKSGKRVRITAQLIEVSSDSHLWSDTYDRELDDIFAVQDDIAQSVVKELRSALMGETAAPAAITSAAADVRQASTGRADNPEAFRLYLQGKFFGERTTQADTDKAIELYRQALAIDPSFALAWAGLSRMHHAQAGHGFAPIAEGFERAREAAQHAVRLAPDLAEGYIELGQVQELYDWDWSAADASYRRALELAPGSAKAVMAAASLARILGRFDVGLELMRKAVALDPLSPRTHRQAAMIYLAADQIDAAAASFELALDINPTTGLIHAFLAITRLLQGRAEEGLALANLESHDVFRNESFAMIHHTLGHRIESDAALQALIDGFGWTAAYQIAEVYTWRNEIEKAFEWLELAYTQRDPGVVLYRRGPPAAAVARRSALAAVPGAIAPGVSVRCDHRRNSGAVDKSNANRPTKGGPNGPLCRWICRAGAGQEPRRLSSHGDASWQDLDGARRAPILGMRG
jgi:TolB-like protein/class 3 adenylate cyclase/predicted TPR repeat methyltransferase